MKCLMLKCMKIDLNDCDYISSMLRWFLNDLTSDNELKAFGVDQLFAFMLAFLPNQMRKSTDKPKAWNNNPILNMRRDQQIEISIL